MAEDSRDDPLVGKLEVQTGAKAVVAHIIHNLHIHPESQPPLPDFRTVVWNAPPRNPFFTGREANLKGIRSAFTQGGSAAPPEPQAISGLGGVGKTQTAVEYAHRYRADYPAVLWSGAESRDILVSGFTALANLLNLPQKDDQDLSVVVAAVRRWLESNSGWLLVLDNVEDLALVSEFMPAGAAGHVLITTRLHATGEFAELVEIRKMEPEEGALLLLRRAKVVPKDQAFEASGEVDRALARQISIEMDGLPLALDQAAAFIEEMSSSLTEYLALYRSEGGALRALRGRLKPSHPSVTITFSLSFARVAQTSPGAADVVRACTFLAPDGIPEELFTQTGSKWGEPISVFASRPLAWLHAIEEAGRFALIHRDPDSKSLHVHRLVQDVVKDEMDSETRRCWAERVVLALSEAFPKAEFQNWPQCELLLPHARIAARLVDEFGLYSAAATRLLDGSGDYLDDRGRYTEAEPLYRRALTIREKLLGPDHPDSAASLNRLAALCRHQGRYTEAELLYRRALAIREKSFGPVHLDTAATLNNLALLYDNQGRYAEAERLYQRVLAIHEKALGSEHPSAATGLNNLASLYHNQGRFADAEPLYRRAVAIKEKAFGSEHPDTATSLNNLALLYGDQSRYDEALTLHWRALAIQEISLGTEHRNTATSLNNLAAVYKQQGRYAEAEPLFRRALTILEKVLGPEHADIATSLNNLAVLQRDQGRYAEAEMLCSRALATREKSLGPEHPDIAASLHNLASLQRDQSRYAEAEPLFRRALSIQEKVLGPDHPYFAASLNGLASLYRDQGRYAEAEPLYRRALTIREKLLGSEHADTAATMRNYAELLRKVGDQAGAEKLEVRVKITEN
jgi:tetratricopeptide (TPR) repeat protein